MKVIVFLLLLAQAFISSGQDLKQAEKLLKEGNFIASKRLYQEALVRQKEKCSDSSLYILKGLITVMLFVGEVDNALERALSYKECKSEGVLSVFNAIGAIYNIKKNADSAIFFYRKALRIRNLDKKAGIHNNLGVLHASNGNLDSSLYYYSLARDYYESRNKKADVISLYNNIGLIYSLQNKKDSALVFYQKSLVANRANQGRYLDNFLALKSLVSKSDLLSDLDLILRADSLAKIIQSKVSRRDDKLRLLRQSSEVFKLGLRLSLSLYQKTKRKSDLNQVFYFSERVKANVLLSKLKTEVVSLAKIQSGLQQNEALIEYFDVAKKLYCIVIRPNKASLIDLGVALDEKFELALKSYTRGVNALGLRKFILESPKMYDLVFAKVDKQLTRVQRLNIIPNLVLSTIPFEGLLSKSVQMNMTGYRTGRYLLKKYLISYHVSATLAMKSSESFSGGFVGFVHSEFANDLDELKSGEKEVLFAKTLYKTQRVYINSQAIPGRLRGLEAKVLHVSTHGYYDFRNATSGIWFKDKTGKDRVLTISELFDLGPKSDLVVLSGCFTAMGKPVDGEGVVNLPYAFLYSGSRFVLSSLYLIPDETTRRFMVKFYTYHKVKGFGVPESLRLAKLDMLKTTLPLFWCSFVLLGR